MTAIAAARPSRQDPVTRRRRRWPLRFLTALAVAAAVAAMSVTGPASAGTIDPGGSTTGAAPVTVVGLTVQVIGGRPAVTLYTTGEIADAESMRGIDILESASPDLLEILDQMVVEMEPAPEPIAEDDWTQFQEELATYGVGLDDLGTARDMIDIVNQIAADRGLDPQHDGYAVFSVWDNTGLSDYPWQRMFEGDGDGAQPTPEELREEADRQAAEARRLTALYRTYRQTARKLGGAYRTFWRGAAKGTWILAHEHRMEAKRLREQARQQEGMPFPDMPANPDLEGLRAYLLSFNPAIEGTEWDQWGLVLAMFEAYGEYQRPLSSYPVPVDDGAGGTIEIEVTTVACVGVGCTVADPTQESTTYEISPSMAKRVLTYGLAGGVTVSYPNPEANSGAGDGTTPPPAGPGPCDLC